MKTERQHLQKISTAAAGDGQTQRGAGLPPNWIKAIEIAERQGKLAQIFTTRGKGEGAI